MDAEVHMQEKCSDRQGKELQIKIQGSTTDCETLSCTSVMTGQVDVIDSLLDLQVYESVLDVGGGRCSDSRGWEHRWHCGFVKHTPWRLPYSLPDPLLFNGLPT